MKMSTLAILLCAVLGASAFADENQAHVEKIKPVVIKTIHKSTDKQPLLIRKPSVEKEQSTLSQKKVILTETEENITWVSYYKYSDKNSFHVSMIDSRETFHGIKLGLTF